MANTHNLPANRPDIALGPQGFFQLEQRHAPPHSALARSTRARIGHSGFRYLPSYSPCPGYVSPPDCDQMETLGTGERIDCHCDGSISSPNCVSSEKRC